MGLSAVRVPMAADVDRELCCPDCCLEEEIVFLHAGGGCKQCNSAKPTVSNTFLIQVSVEWPALTT